MSWAQWHQQSERLASDASEAYAQNAFDSARDLYAQAAEAEYKALQRLEPGKPRTQGITAVSVVSLWFKARVFDRAEQVAYAMLSTGGLPDFAQNELRTLVQAIWTESSKKEAGVAFLPGQVYVSVKGGEVVTGGAPLDLVVDKVQAIQALFFRTIEEAKSLPLRKRGAPTKEIQEACRPWLFQAPPGSYQFSVAIQDPRQKDFFNVHIPPDQIAERFLSILSAASSGDSSALEGLVQDEGYRSTFLKLARNLAPTGKSFDSIEVRTAGEARPVSLSPESRRAIGHTLRASAPKVTINESEQEVALKGTLRALDLDKDWIDIAVDGSSIRVTGLKDAVDDVIGPMVNRSVVVRAIKDARSTYQFLDIELEE